MRVVIALGGNALLRRGEPADTELQRRNVAVAVTAIAQVAREHQVVVTHGNGPQVGLLALQSEAYREATPYPLDVMDAGTEGMIGYLIEQALHNELPGRSVATLLTQVVVDADDPAFDAPSKPIGPGYGEAEAEELTRQRGWVMVRDGDRFRRAVPSPEPRRIIELETIRLLMEAGVLVVCAGGGGIPVVEDETGALHGIEAVVDKDLAAALLASELGADALLLLTDVDAVYDGWPMPAAQPLRVVSPEELRAKTFEAGTMAPKVEAACRFAERGGRRAFIGALGDAARMLAMAAGAVGTCVRADVASDGGDA